MANKCSAGEVERLKQSCSGATGGLPQFAEDMQIFRFGTRCTGWPEKTRHSFSDTKNYAKILKIPTFSVAILYLSIFFHVHKKEKTVHITENGN